MSTKTKTAPLSSYRDPIILITGCVIGAILGLVFGDKVSFLKPIGQIFLNLLFCLIVPLIFFSIAGSIANTKDTGKVGKMIGLTLLIFVTTAILSAILILVVTHFTGVPTNFTAVTKNAAAAKPISVSDQIVGTLTVGDLPLLISRYHVLPLIIMTIFFGICVSRLGDEAKPIIDWMNAMTKVCYKMVAYLMKLAPLGLGAYFADLTGTYGIELLKTYGNAMLVFYSVVFLYFFLFLGFYAFLAAGPWGVRNFFKVILAPALTALGHVRQQQRFRFRWKPVINWAYRVTSQVLSLPWAQLAIWMEPASPWSMPKCWQRRCLGFPSKALPSFLPFL